MKYILMPVLLMIFVAIAIAFVPLRTLWHLVWHFELISFQRATSFISDETSERVYLFDCSTKQFFYELFFPYKKRNEDEDIYS